LDRNDERQRIEDAWGRAVAGQPQLAIVWGRRRVGKTFLLSHFITDKRAVFFGATEQAQGIELARLHEAVQRDLGSDVADLAGGGFASWEAALRYLVALATEHPLCVVLDEVPYLTRSTPGFPSVVQVIWDHLRPGTRLMLVLTGSAVGTIERMLGAGGALRGRPTLSMRLDPLDPVAARVFLPRLPAGGFIEAYAACGGYPLHLRAWDQSVGTDANLLRLAGTPGGLLLDDARGILREELPDIGGYPRILAAIGRGRTRISEIGGEAGQRVEHPLGVLIEAGFVGRNTPVGATRAARAAYQIADPYLAFWFGVLYSSIDRIEAGQGRAVLKARRHDWQRHLGWVFEAAARGHASRLVASGQLPEDLVVGRWWATKGSPCEVDVLGLRRGRTALVGEARWQAAPLAARDVRELTAKLACVPNPVADPLLALWGRNGVERGVAGPGVMGFSAEDVISG
jgi:hypothetical protein